MRPTVPCLCKRNHFICRRTVEAVSGVQPLWLWSHRAVYFLFFLWRTDSWSTSTPLSHGSAAGETIKDLLLHHVDLTLVCSKEVYSRAQHWYHWRRYPQCLAPVIESSETRCVTYRCALICHPTQSWIKHNKSYLMWHSSDQTTINQSMYCLKCSLTLKWSQNTSG